MQRYKLALAISHIGVIMQKIRNMADGMENVVMNLRFAKTHTQRGGFPGNQGPPSDNTISKLIGDWGMEEKHDTSEATLDSAGKIITKVVVCHYRMDDGKILESIEEARQYLLKRELSKALRKYPNITDAYAEEIADILIGLDLSDIDKIARDVNAQVDIAARS